MFVMGLLLALYAWGAVSGITPLNRQIIVPPIVAIAAASTLIVTFILYLTVRAKRLTLALFAPYTLSLISLAMLVTLTGGSGSAFLGLLVAMLVFAGVFTTSGVLISVGTIAGLVTYELLVAHEAMGELATIAIVLLVPTMVGYVLWVRLESGATPDASEDKAYSELASELSQVAGKSEVVINAITDGVLALDGHGTVQLINPAAQQLLGWTKHDALTLTYKSVLKILDSKSQVVNDANDPVAQAIATNKVVRSDSFSLETEAGKTFLASISVSPVGQLGNGVIVVFRDVTTEKSDERQRAEFISTASHEMRTPVASIEGYLGLALNPATATIDEKARDFILKAHESAQHLGRLFSDLLDVSKADDSRLKNDPEIVDVVPFIHDIVEGLTPKAVEKGLHVFYKPMPSQEAAVGTRMNPVYYANVDNDHLREIVQNLVENAIKYTPSGDVVVDVTGDDLHIVVSVADTGIGIPREDQAHLFQKFYRVDSSDTREIGGTGLGLYLCRRLTETIGGRIWVESDYKKGSTFYVELPRTSHDDAIHMIEQASIVAEQRSQPATAQRTMLGQTSQPAEPTVAPAPQPAILTVPSTTQPAPPVQGFSQQVTPQPTALPLPTPIAIIAQPAAPAPTPAPMTPRARPLTPAQNTPVASPERPVNRPQALDIVVPPRASTN